MIEPRRVTLYTVSEEKVLLETPLTPGGYWMQYKFIPKLIKDYTGGQLTFEDPPEEYGAFYTEMQAHHVVNQFSEDMFVSFEPKVAEIFRACEAARRRKELDKRDRDIDRLKGIIKKLEMAGQIIRAETEERFEEDIKSLRFTIADLERRAILAEQDAYRYSKNKLMQNAFVYSPPWRRLWIALFPSKHFK